MIRLELPAVTRVRDADGGSHVEPPLDPGWSEREQLAWLAAVVAHDTGIGVAVHAAGRLYSVQLSAGDAVSSTTRRDGFQGTWRDLSQISWGGGMARRAVAAEVLARHRPWYVVDTAGTRVEHRVYVAVEDPAELPAGHVCVTEVDPARGRYEVCEPEEGEHQVLACWECRQFTDDGDPGAYLLWPCPTALAVDPSLAGGAPGGASS